MRAPSAEAAFAFETHLDGYRFCTYRVGGVIDAMLQPQTIAEATEGLSWVVHEGLPLTVLGSGSNTLLASAGVRGVLFSSRRLTEMTVLSPGRYRIGAGVPLAKAARWMQAESRTGCEYMMGIPGTIGGAVAMNAGAMGQETASVVETVSVLDLKTGEIQELPKSALGFAYRISIINPQTQVVLGAVLTLPEGDPQAIDTAMKASLTFRQSHHPKEPNGGSVFKNPAPDAPAGKLLDQLGAKTWVEGGARVSPLHANFIVNLGGATSGDILRLMLKGKQAVKAAYGFDLHPENRFLGDATPEEQALWQALTF
jgi:UDP-N-acetylmuramate dehydrogenase